MFIKQFIHAIRVDPVNLTLKSKLMVVLACFSTIGLVIFINQHGLAMSAHPVFMASIGASAIIVFMTPNSPAAQPWALLVGQLVSATVGVTANQLFNDVVWAAPCAVAGSVLLMLLLRCLHPPGAATALAPVIAGEAGRHLAYGFVLVPVASNMVCILIIAIVINRWLLGHNYPSFTLSAVIKQDEKLPKTQAMGISRQDLQQALQDQNTYVDITSDELNRVLLAAQQQSFKRTIGFISCKDIMVTPVTTVEYGTEIEEAWRIMHRGHLKVMPVVDKAQRVIGLLSWDDFFKSLDTTSNRPFQERFRVFVKRTQDVSTTKPEAVGHVMSKSVSVLPETTHIVELIPLMSQQNYRHIPIVNEENRLVGMVDQSHLIAALYHQQIRQSTVGEP